MMPARTQRIRWTVWLAAGLIFGSGCSESALRLQSPEALEEALEDVRLVRHICVPFGGHPLEIESDVLIGSLAGTGSDPAPSARRSTLLTEMQKRGVYHPNRVLSSSSTSLAIARAILPPGIQKGDRFDVEVFVPNSSETTSLRDGVMYPTKLHERAVVGGRMREGDLLARAKGPVLVDPLAHAENAPAKLRRGVILGGGTAAEARPLGLVLKPDFQKISTSSHVGAAINQRFYLTVRGIKRGVAEPKTEQYIDLTMHPRYKDNMDRYLSVVRSVAVEETTSQRHLRMELLERQLLDPITASNASIQLEAIGSEAIDVLKTGLEASDPSVRFYAAEALAYLDVAEAASPLGQAARDEPAFRAYALTALSAMDEPAARDELLQLLNTSSAETRYGAFRALWAMNRNDPRVRGESMNDQFSFHLIRSDGPPMIHVTRSIRPEIVMFDPDQTFRTPLILDAGKRIRVNGKENGKITVSRFTPGQPDRQIEVSAKIDAVIRAIVELGGTYPDVVQALAQAKTTKSMVCRFEVDVAPRRGRKYQPSDPQIVRADNADEGFQVESPVPDLYRSNSDESDDPEERSDRK